jgi:hypothetical protein
MSLVEEPREHDSLDEIEMILAQEEGSASYPEWSGWALLGILVLVALALLVKFAVTN